MCSSCSSALHRLPNTMISCNLLSVFLSTKATLTSCGQKNPVQQMFVLLICPLFQGPLLLELLQQMTGLKISRVQTCNHFVCLIKEHFNSIWKKVQLPQEAKMQRSWAKGKFQNPKLSMVHLCRWHAFSFTVPQLTWNAQKAKKIPCPR